MKKSLTGTVLFSFFCFQFINAQQFRQVPIDDISIPAVATIRSPEGKLIVAQNSVSLRKLDARLYYATIKIVPGSDRLASEIDIPLSIRLNDSEKYTRTDTPFHWLPNMKSAPEQIISQHVFRSPCMILTWEKKSVVLIPDLDLLAKNTAAPYYMDLKYTDTAIQLHYGLSNYKVASHQYYTKTGKTFFIPDSLQIGFYLLFPNNSRPVDLLKLTNSFLWTRFAKSYTTSVLPQTVSYSHYAETGYQMAIDRYWVDAGYERGGITLSTFLDDSSKIYRGRDSKDDLWYQSWFNNMRTAYGMYSWGRQLNRPDWNSRSLKIVRLLMSAPNNQGWFPTVYDKQTDNWVSSGQGGGAGLYHVPDNAWTYYWLLRYTDELQSIPGVNEKLTGFADALLKVQNDDGSFPTRVNDKTLAADEVLNHTASSAMATWYLEELLIRNKIKGGSRNRYLDAVKKSIEFLGRQVLPKQRFEDFESYFSCSPKPMHYYDSSTRMYSQNTLSIQWCAEAYLKAYTLFHKKSDLIQGEYCLNILSLYQQIWNPPFIHLYSFGGFGTQNSDAEWSDARQAQFADTYLQYYLQTNNEEYLQRGIYACRASFALMVLPENKDIAPENYAGTKINGEEWVGNMAENYGHDGQDKRSHQSGFHWGTGSALTTAAIFKNTLGDLYIDFTGRTATGIDGMVVEESTWDKIPRIKTKRIRSDGPVMIKANDSMKHEIMLDNGITNTENK